MYQFYFLSVLLNLLIGLIFVAKGDNFESLTREMKGEEATEDNRSLLQRFLGHGSITDERLFQVVVGCITVFVSLVKLFVPVGSIEILGDFIPSVVGLCGGLSMIISYIIDNSDVDINLPVIIETICVDNRKYIGYACIVASVLHFMLPTLIFF